MALSADRRQQLRLYLGYPSTGFQVDRVLENAMNAVDSQARPELEAMIGVGLDECIAIDAQITSGRAREKYKQIEDVHYNVGGELAGLRSRGSMHVRRLATLVGAPVHQDPFTGSPMGGLMRHG